LGHALAVEDEGLKTSFFEGGRVSCLNHGKRVAGVTTDVK
jgi:hypothetical protein